MEAKNYINEVTMQLNLQYVPRPLEIKHQYARNFIKYSVLHQAGHALGFFHEHQHPIFHGKDVFNEAKIIEDLMKEFGFPKDKAILFYRENFESKETKDAGQEYYPFDRDSIMRYE